MGKLFTVTRFAAKASIAAGSIYVTNKNSFWGTPEESVELYNKILKSPQIYELKSQYLTGILPDKITEVDVKSIWNSIVFKVFNFLADSPSKFSQLSNYVVEKIISYTN